MDAQSLIVGFIVLGAAGYIGSLVYKRVRSFSRKKRCGNDCGCDKT